jgi:ferredoxin-NADP reductase
MPGVVMVSGGISGCGLTPLLGMLSNHFRLAAYQLTGNMQMLHQHTKKVKNTMQQTTDQFLSPVSAVKLWNMSLQNTYLTIWKATVYYMIR